MAKILHFRPTKDKFVLSKIKDSASRGDYIPVEHAKQRLNEREVTDPEVRYVLKYGYRELKKDEYKPEHRAWNYAISGKTMDGRKLRIIVSFDENLMLIITVIDLEN